MKKDISDLKAKEYKEDVLFADSYIIENNFERKFLQSSIKDVDTSKKYIYPVLIYKENVDGTILKFFMINMVIKIPL